jgi:hypothetical protein
MAKNDIYIGDWKRLSSKRKTRATKNQAGNHKTLTPYHVTVYDNYSGKGS